MKVTSSALLLQSHDFGGTGMDSEAYVARMQIARAAKQRPRAGKTRLAFSLELWLDLFPLPLLLGAEAMPKQRRKICFCPCPPNTGEESSASDTDSDSGSRSSSDSFSSCDELDFSLAVAASSPQPPWEACSQLLAQKQSQPLLRPLPNHTAMARRPIVGGNWKCNPESMAKLDGLVENMNACDASKCDIYVCPSPLHVAYVCSKVKAGINVCPQNCNFKGCGAYTGEVAVEQMKDLKIEWVLIGHSERREYFKESNELLAEKMKLILDSGMKCVYAIGEKLPEREKGLESTMAVCIEQLEMVKGLLDPAKVVIAYEPVWAIGTGVTATAAQAQETHAEIRKWIAKNVSEKCAAGIRIQYGGSANAKNAPELSACPDIDGFLVGGASLKPEFKDIVDAISARIDSLSNFLATSYQVALQSATDAASERVLHLCRHDLAPQLLGREDVYFGNIGDGVTYQCHQTRQNQEWDSLFFTPDMLAPAVDAPAASQVSATTSADRLLGKQLSVHVRTAQSQTLPPSDLEPSRSLVKKTRSVSGYAILNDQEVGGLDPTLKLLLLGLVEQG
ncbi:Triosephosphate isomerase [Symbiodinium microadriaticum]|uniref:triose-phosphate isomerase n=2 Tax=Symbiodinium TaxID=2949 RepID=A0A1Q9EV79_SYMMI|nr:Triosephosphate isomerase [Symbiodinium microadriaticum]